MTSVPVAGVGIEPTSRRSERRVLPADDPAMCCLRVPGRRNRTYDSWFKARQPTVSTIPGMIISHCQSALRESNPPLQLGRLAPLPLGQGHMKRKERESNPQGSSLDCFRDSCHRQLACPSVTSCGGRNRTCVGRLTGACPYQHGPHRNMSQGASDLNQRSPVPEAGGIARLSQRRNQKHPAGVEPALPPWQGSRLPLHHGRLLRNRFNCQRTTEHRVGLEPTLPHYGCGVLAAGRPVHFVSVGPEGSRTLTASVKSQGCCR